MTVKNGALLITSIICVILIVYAYFITKNYLTLSAQVEALTNRQNTLIDIGMTSNTFLTSGLLDLEKKFLNNSYLLRDADNSVLIDMKTICEQKNGVNCVHNNNGELEFVGNN
ncbi:MULTISPECIES: hypothetical protein [Cysteiniphilum]|uniref:hypothetical protein n=1 Tax=Cysteiniphilum TaxID=2056696 RepID=UPI00177C5EE8|nr:MULTISPECIES: hypothetical protein [Cysteiniphilum]